MHIHVPRCAPGCVRVPGCARRESSPRAGDRPSGSPCPQEASICADGHLGHAVQSYRAGTGCGGGGLTWTRRPTSPPVLPVLSGATWLILGCPQGLGTFPGWEWRSLSTPESVFPPNLGPPEGDAKLGEKWFPSSGPADPQPACSVTGGLWRGQGLSLLSPVPSPPTPETAA